MSTINYYLNDFKNLLLFLFSFFLKFCFVHFLKLKVSLHIPSYRGRLPSMCLGWSVI